MLGQNKRTVGIALIVAILLLVNVVSDQFFFRLDFTADKQYTLSKATEDLLDNLQEPVTITAYFSEDLPPNIAKTKNDFQDLLIEYANLSDGMVVYEFINPNENEETERQAMQNGVSPVMINVREKDQMKQQKAFLGALIQMGEQKDVIPFMKPGAAMEYALSSSIKKLSVVDKPTVGILQGHGEPAVSELFQAQTSLSILYNVESVTLTDSTPIEERFKTIAIVAPSDSFPVSHLYHLDAFLARGGNLLIAMNRVNGDFSTAQGSEVNTGLEGWLSSKGIQVEPTFVVDVNCGSVTVQQQQGMFRYNTNVSFPFLPIISQFEKQPAVEGLEAVMLTFASPIKYTGDSSIKFIPLATTSEKSGTVSTPTYFNVQKQWAENDFPLSKITVAATFEGNLAGNTPSKMIVISDGDFAVNGPRERAQNLQPDNVNLLVNSIDWLTDETGLIELRTKGVSSRPLDQIEDSTKSLLKYLNFLLPILFIIIYGVVRFQIKRNIRIKRMEENYA